MFLDLLAVVPLVPLGVMLLWLSSISSSVVTDLALSVVRNELVYTAYVQQVDYKSKERSLTTTDTEIEANKDEGNRLYKQLLGVISFTDFVSEQVTHESQH